MEDKFLENRKIVYIMTDTQRWDMLNCYRETGLKTPHLDHMASEGIRYSRAYTTSPVCEPARSCIFTGMYPHSNGGWSNGAALGDNVHTIGERLQDKGIHTAYIGKWHLDGSDYFGLGRCPKGWDNKYWYDGRNYLEELSDEDRVMSRKAESMEKRDFPPEFTFAHKCVDRAIDFLNNHGDEDFFLAVSIDEPHAPSLCPREFYEMYEDFEFPKSPNIYDTLENKPDYQKAWAGDKLYEDKDALELKSKYFFGCNSLSIMRSAGCWIRSNALRRMLSLSTRLITAPYWIRTHCITKAPVFTKSAHIFRLLSRAKAFPETWWMKRRSHMSISRLRFLSCSDLSCRRYSRGKAFCLR
jgi:uncharacterized sulfatase